MSWYNLLFNPGEYIYFGYTHADGLPRPRFQGPCSPDAISDPSFNFFILNPFPPAATNAKGENLAAFRNILVEFDTHTRGPLENQTMPLEAQKDVIRETGMPFSMVTYSGGKSYHFIISLAEDVSRDAYAALVARIYAALGARCDTKCKNPNRFTRTPNAIRSNGKPQELMGYDKRVPLEAVEAWLLSRGILPTPAAPRPKAKVVDGAQALETDAKIALLSRKTIAFLKKGTKTDRNDTLFKASCDAFRCGFFWDEWLELVDECAPTDLEDTEIEICLNSGWRSVHG